ncbi:MAG: hypothetical protein ACU843_07830 [Gammaproteobacteria bacterium]
MSTWDIISEEASIVLVGNINPKIFHPEWFIRKGIVEEWDYTNDEIVNIPDLSKITFPGNRYLTVFLNKFILRSTLASENLGLKDLVTSTFATLRETPIDQMGMNYTSTIKISSTNHWSRFGIELAPKKCWQEALSYFNDLDAIKKGELGLWEMTMNLPRSDDLPGYIRPKIAVQPPSSNRTLLFSINNHVNIDESNAITMARILKDHWENSLFFAKSLISDIMDSQLKDAK